MSYRDEILDYVGECLGGISGTLKSSRVDELRVRDIEQIIEQLRELSTQADLVLIEARQDNRT